MRKAGLLPEREGSALPPQIPPEEKYARELAAWKAGHTSHRRLGEALGIGRSAAASHIAKMREAGLLPECEGCASIRHMEREVAAV